MKTRSWLIPVLILLLPLASCHFTRSKVLNRRITLWRKDKIPYGDQIAYDGLPYLFPNATVSVNRKAPSYLQTGEGKKAYIIIVPEMDPTPADINALLNFVGDGNHVFISAERYGDSLMHSLSLRGGYKNRYALPRVPDSLQLSIYHPVTGDSVSFAYPGDSFDGWVTSLDSQYTTILGRDHSGRPDLVRFNYKGGGSLYLHFAPLAFSNFFLLHRDNISYYNLALSYLPQTVQEVIWDEYFRYDHTRDFSAWQYIFSNRALRWAFWLLLLLFALIYIFESKRKQRSIPLIEPLRNTSLDFVRTIGRLYFQRRDNHNLATKMATHFQDQVRTRYNLAVTTLDDDFVARLSYKTGYQRESLSRLVGYMRELPSKAYVPDEELLDFHRQLEAFYKLV
jgi:hypothetical protein